MFITCCVCVKRMALSNCLYSSSHSSRDFASVFRNIGKFGARNYFTDHRTANTILFKRFSSGPESTWLLGCAIIWATFHSNPSDKRREQCVDVYNPLQAVFKRFKLYVLAQIVWEINYCITEKCFSQYS